jgi:hypothetical protein
MTCSILSEPVTSVFKVSAIYLNVKRASMSEMFNVTRGQDISQISQRSLVAHSFIISPTDLLRGTPVLSASYPALFSIARAAR